MKFLTRADEILLLAILRLKDNAYGTTIIKEVKKKTRKELTFGSLWVSLDSLYKKGLINKRLSDEVPSRGGRKKIYYTLTISGIKSLQEAREIQNSLWKGVHRLLKKYQEEQ
jgi:PadR family transcriptional regulator PadR